VEFIRNITISKVQRISKLPTKEDTAKHKFFNSSLLISINK